MTSQRTFTRRNFLAQCAATGAALTVASRGATAQAGQPDSSRPICVFSKHLQFLDYGAMAEAAAEAGFDGVDLTVRPGGHVEPERAVEDLPRAVEAVERAGLAVYLMTTRITDAEDPLTEPILQTAARHGIGAYRMGYLSYDDQLGVAGTLEALKPQFQALAALNEQYGVHGAYQNHAGTRVGGPVWDLWTLLEELDPRWLGCQYDIRHAVAEGGTAWPLGLNLLHPYIRTLCIKDFHWAETDQGWRIRDVPLGEGMVDFDAYFKQLKALTIEGPLSVHYEYPMPEHDESLKAAERRARTVAAMKQDVETLRRMMAEAGL